jgi:hypothetical protein
MDFSFGIVTDGKNDAYLIQLCNSIYLQNIPNYEIIIVGNTKLRGHRIKNIEFDETVHQGWITKKKNIIGQVAKYQNIVLMHDYLLLDMNWYKGFLEFGNDFFICTTRILTKKMERFRDYILFPLGLDSEFRQNPLLPYDIVLTPNISRLMYISGSFFVIKKSLFDRVPLNEKLLWGQQEDLEFCQRLKRVVPDVLFHINSHSITHIQKDKSCSYGEVSEIGLKLLASYTPEQFNEFYETQDKILQKSFEDTLTG